MNVQRQLVVVLSVLAPDGVLQSLGLAAWGHQFFGFTSTNVYAVNVHI